MKFGIDRRRLLVGAILFCVLRAGDSAAQDVHKCVVDGKTTYQTEPCATGGKVINLPAAPSAEQQREALKRNFDEQNRRHEAETERAAAERNAIYKNAGTTTAKAAPDCAALNKQLADAYGQRNGMVRGNQGMMWSGEMARMDQQNSNEITARINSTTQQLNQAGCKIN